MIFPEIICCLAINIKLRLFKLMLWSPSWSGNTASVIEKLFDQPNDFETCDLNYPRRIRAFSSILCEIEKFYFGPQPCQKLDSLLDCKNNLHSNYNSDQQIGCDFERVIGLIFGPIRIWNQRILSQLQFLCNPLFKFVL